MVTLDGVGMGKPGLKETTSVPLPGSSFLSHVCAWTGPSLWMSLTWSIPSTFPQAGYRVTSCSTLPGLRDFLVCGTLGAREAGLCQPGQ